MHSGAPADREGAAGGLRTRARKVKPQYCEGSLIKVVGAGNQSEGEFIQALLLEEGVPSMLRRSPHFDVPCSGSGPLDVLVPESGVLPAREVLLQSRLDSSPGRPGRRSSIEGPTRAMAWMLLALLTLSLVVSLLTRL